MVRNSLELRTGCFGSVKPHSSPHAKSAKSAVVQHWRPLWDKLTRLACFGACEHLQPSCGSPSVAAVCLTPCSPWECRLRAVVNTNTHTHYYTRLDSILAHRFNFWLFSRTTCISHGARISSIDGFRNPHLHTLTPTRLRVLPTVNPDILLHRGARSTSDCPICSERVDIKSATSVSRVGTTDCGEGT